MEYNCPVSTSVLKKIEIDFFEFKDTKTGFFYSEAGYVYPIINGVPIFLTYATPIVTNFIKNYKKIIKENVPNFKTSYGTAPVGEISVQKTFTEEWSGLGSDENVFAYNHEEGLALHKEVWLGKNSERFESVKDVMIVGCGAGREAEYLSNIFINSCVHAVDINLELIANGERLLKSKKIKPIIASLFSLPFQNESFDHIHCQGVAHHTVNTKDAYFSIYKHLRNNNSSFFFWVYGWEDSFGTSGIRGLFKHIYYFTSHRIFRPILSRSPSMIRNCVVFLISAVYHPIVNSAGRRKKIEWRFKNTLHAVRDMFTPRFAHRHRHNEIYEWFEIAEFDQIHQQSAKKYQEMFHVPIVGIGYLGKK